MHPTIVKIDYNILKDNFIALKNHFHEISLSPVVKAEAYGHGLIEASKAFIKGGAERLGVFRLEEAAQLRKAGISVPIWVLCGALPQEAEQAAALENVTFGVFSTEQLNALSKAGIKAGKSINIHIAVDTV